MRILRVAGRNEKIVMEQIQKEYGDNFTLMSGKEEKSQGILGFFTKQYTATIAVKGEDEIDEETNTLQEGTEKNLLNTEYEGIEKGEFEESPDRLATQEILRALRDSKTNEDESLLLQISKQLKEMSVDVATLKRNKLDGERQEDIMRKSIEESLIADGVDKTILDEYLRDSTEDDTVVSLSRDLKERLVNELNCSNREMPRVVYFVGSTGVGKTTTIAKLLAKKVLDEGKKVVLFTSDTYRIAAIEQLKIYAEILKVPIEVIYTPEDAKHALEKWREADYIFIDTAGRSHKNTEHIEELKKLLDVTTEKLMLLVLNVNTRYSDLKDIINVYKGMASDFELVATKLDETNEIGNLLNLVKYSECPVRYITNGQNVPEDIEKFDMGTFIDELVWRVSV